MDGNYNKFERLLNLMNEIRLDFSNVADFYDCRVGDVIYCTSNTQEDCKEIEEELIKHGYYSVTYYNSKCQQWYVEVTGRIAKCTC